MLFVTPWPLGVALYGTSSCHIALRPQSSLPFTPMLVNDPATMPSLCPIPRISHWNSSVLILSFLAVCLLPNSSEGMPFLVLENTATKCMTLDIGQESVAKITYDAPGMFATQSVSGGNCDTENGWFCLTPNSFCSLMIDLKVYGDSDDPNDRKGRKNVRMVDEDASFLIWSSLWHVFHCSDR